jgi:hypothetical protein
MVKVNKKINLAQLDKELNGKGLNADKDKTGTIISVSLTENNPATIDELQAAIESHIAKPEPEPTIEDKLASVGLTIASLKTALGI